MTPAPNLGNGSGIPPWQMWGSSQPVQLGLGLATAQVQLAQVRYKRPDNWQFMLGARLVSSNYSAGAASLSIVYSLTLGVGRSVLQIPAWHTFTITIPPAPASGNSQKWTGQVQPPNPLDTTPAATLPAISAVTAETIVLQANVTIIGAQPLFGDSVNLQVDGLFAPSTHVRPEWYEHGYPGGELGGA